MKVLVDTVVWSLALRRRPGTSLTPAEQNLKAILAEAIKDGRVVIIGPIRQELLSGLKHRDQMKKLQAHLAHFDDEPIIAEDYVAAAYLDHICRSAGVKCGTVDMLICAIAERNGWEILTNDSGLLRCLEVVKKKRP